MHGYIYKTTNLINGKIYIGQHVSQKFEPTRYIGSGAIFTKAIQKYGFKNFNCELICWAKDQEELDMLEIFYIAKFEAMNPNIGYNLCYGGKGGSLGYRFTTEQKKYLSEVHMGHKNTPEAIKKQADSLRGRIWMHKDLDRKMIKKEDVQKYLDEGWNIGTNIEPYQSKAVICFETGERFPSIMSVQEKYPKSGALKRCVKNDPSSTCCNLHWYLEGDEERREKIAEIIANTNKL